MSSCTWGRGGKWIAFSRMGSTRSVDVWVVPVAGGNPTNITYYPGTNYLPDWTRDGKYLLFVSDRDRQGFTALYAVPLQKEKEEPESPSVTPQASTPDKKPVEVKIDFDDIENRAKRLSTQGAGGFSITPDSRIAVFLSPSGGSSEFWSVPVRGGTVQKLTSGGEGTDNPHITEDGSRIYALGQGGTIKCLPRGAASSTQVAF